MMMEWLYKILSRIEFYVLLVLIATVLVFFALFKDLPNPANGYSPSVREATLSSLLIFGIGVFVSGVVSFFVVRTRIRPKEDLPEKRNDLPKTRSSETSDVTSQVESLDPTPASTDELEWEEKLVITYKDLPKTQQRIVRLICEMPPVQMPIDDFWKAFSSKFGNEWVSNDSEMKYRIEVLSLRGFCELRKIGPGSSVVIRDNKVSKCLRSRDLLMS